MCLLWNALADCVTSRMFWAQFERPPSAIRAHSWQFVWVLEHLNKIPSQFLTCTD
jgi:hypothetical protein